MIGCISPLRSVQFIAKTCSPLPHIQGINKNVDIVECIQSKVDVAQLLGINAFSLDKLLADDPDFLVGLWASGCVTGAWD